MNLVVLEGIITKRGVDFRNLPNGTGVASLSVGCKREFKNKETGKYENDFINVKAFGKTAEFIINYFSDGSAINIVGRIQTGSYEKDGVKIYTTDVIAEKVGFPSKSFDNGSSNTNNSGVCDLTQMDDGELPF